MYSFFLFIEDNKIEVEGALYLSKSTWPNMNEYIKLMYFLIFCIDNNKIRAKGIEYISKTKWYDLTTLNLSIIIIL